MTHKCMKKHTNAYEYITVYDVLVLKCHDGMLMPMQYGQQQL